MSRAQVHVPGSLGALLCDRVAAAVGSWRFLLAHATWFTVWLVVRPEPFPFGLLTLIVSLEAIFLSTILLMAQNRQAERDRKRDDTEACEVALLLEINQAQYAILRLLESHVLREEETCVDDVP